MILELWFLPISLLELQWQHVPHSRIPQFHEPVKSFFNLCAFQHAVPLPEDPHFKLVSEFSIGVSRSTLFYQSSCHMRLQQRIDFSVLPSVSSSNEKMCGFLCLWCWPAWQQINLKLDEKYSQNSANTPAIAFNVWGKCSF